MILANNSPL